jgi:hypothetical protein
LQFGLISGQEGRYQGLASQERDQQEDEEWRHETKQEAQGCQKSIDIWLISFFFPAGADY